MWELIRDIKFDVLRLQVFFLSYYFLSYHVICRMWCVAHFVNTVNKAVIKFNQELGRCIAAMVVYWFGTGSEEHKLYLGRDRVYLNSENICGF